MIMRLIGFAVVAITLWGSFVRAEAAKPSIVRSDFGKTSSGELVEAFDLVNASGVKIRLLTLGATLAKVEVPDRNGKMADVVFGFDTVAEYESDKNQYFGCTTGRYANRIDEGKFELDGEAYQLAINNEPNHLHGGGPRALSKVVWKAQPVQSKRGVGVEFKYISPDGEENYPGKLDLSVTYTLTDSGSVRIVYAAKTDKATPINLTNHAYFNLAGAGAPTLVDHVLKINASRYVVSDDTLIPTGEIATTTGTLLDFSKPKPMLDRVEELSDTGAKGYDHCYVLNEPKSSEGKLRLAAVLTHPDSGRELTIRTDQPGLQYYSGNFLFGQEGKGGATYAHRSGCCLETMHFPDSPNHPDFPSTILRPGETYTQLCIYAFGVTK